MFLVTIKFNTISNCHLLVPGDFIPSRNHKMHAHWKVFMILSVTFKVENYAGCINNKNDNFTH